MPVELTARRLSQSVLEGFKRFERFRKARADHIRSYVGKYMAETQGMTGEEPINLVFLAVRSLIPNLVQKEGINRVLTKLIAQRDYAEKLGLALNDLQKQLRMARLLRACAVDACFGLTVTKTSLASSGQELVVAPDLLVDPGQIYTERISLDDMTADPVCTDWDRATFIGHRVRIERNKLLAAGGFDEALVKRLPKAGASHEEKAAELSRDDDLSGETYDLQDYVNIVELWVPEAESVCYLPDPTEAVSNDFLKIEDYYGPPSGPYTFGSLTQPVPDNPFPVAPVGVWRDLSDMANKLLKKVMGQADRQKNVTLYRPNMADTAEAVRDAYDGEMIPTEDPDGVKTVSYEGPSAETVAMTNTMYGWFNLMAGNPDLMSGAGINADKATGQQILQQNASIGVGDMRDMMYDFAAEISGKQAWFLHNDPLLFVPGQPGIPLIKRTPGGDEQQLFLTPSDKTGEFETLGFEIVKRSMAVLDPGQRALRVTQFTSQTVPQAFQCLLVAMQAGQPFNIQKYLTLVADDEGIVEIVDEIFTDPSFQARMAWYASTMAKPAKMGGGASASPQNGAFPVGGSAMPDPMQQFNMQAQQTAGQGQAAATLGAGWNPSGV